MLLCVCVGLCRPLINSAIFGVFKRVLCIWDNTTYIMISQGVPKRYTWIIGCTKKGVYKTVYQLNTIDTHGVQEAGFVFGTTQPILRFNKDK